MFNTSCFFTLSDIIWSPIMKKWGFILIPLCCILGFLLFVALLSFVAYFIEFYTEFCKEQYVRLVLRIRPLQLTIAEMQINPYTTPSILMRHIYYITRQVEYIETQNKSVSVMDTNMYEYEDEADAWAMEWTWTNFMNATHDFV